MCQWLGNLYFTLSILLKYCLKYLVYRGFVSYIMLIYVLEFNSLFGSCKCES